MKCHQKTRCDKVFSPRSIGRDRKTILLAVYTLNRIFVVGNAFQYFNMWRFIESFCMFDDLWMFSETNHFQVFRFLDFKYLSFLIQKFFALTHNK